MALPERSVAPVKLVTTVEPPAQFSEVGGVQLLEFPDRGLPGWVGCANALKDKINAINSKLNVFMLKGLCLIKISGTYMVLADWIKPLAL